MIEWIIALFVFCIGMVAVKKAQKIDRRQEESWWKLKEFGGWI